LIKAVPSYRAGGATAPPEKLASEYYLFIAASLSYHGLTYPTELLQSRFRSSDIQLGTHIDNRSRLYYLWYAQVWSAVHSIMYTIRPSCEYLCAYACGVHVY